MKYAKQGHTYLLSGIKVLAIESGEVVRVCEIDDTKQWPLLDAITANASDLVPLPMTYFHGDTPK